MIGRVLSDRYLVKELIGEGGMATVYRAVDQRLGREVALKVLREQYARDPEFVRRFQQEAHAVASLNHPHIAAVYDVGTDGGVHYIVMELLPSRTLKEVLRSQGALSPERAVDIAIQVARALQHAHERGLIHRDIKPQNILFASEGQVKVSDFGIARALGGASATEMGTVLGSVHYMSPEQVGGAPAGPPSDLYSLGVLLYEMLTGQRPYEGDSPIETAQKHLQGGFLPPQRLRPQVPAALDAAVRKAMAQHPSGRFASAREMEQALRATVGGAADETTVTQVFPGASTPTAPRPRPSDPGYRHTPPPEPPPRPWFWAALALVLLVGSVGLVAGIFMPDLIPRWGARSRQVGVPEVVGLPMREAQALLGSYDLSWSVIDEIHTREYEPGYVIAQEPAPGTRVAAGTQVGLTMNLGVRTVPVPQVEEMSVGRARRELVRALLEPGRVEEREDEVVPQGYVIASLPKAGTVVEEGSPVDLIVSAGPPAPEPPPEPTPPQPVEPPTPSIAFGGPFYSEDPNEPDRRTVNVVITIPRDSPQREVRITQTPVGSEQEAPVLARRVPPGETITQEIVGDGPMEVRIYLDGRLEMTQTF